MIFEKEIDFFRRLDSTRFGHPHQKITTPTRSAIKSTVHSELRSSTDVDYLVAFSTTKQSYCVGCVDMVNSTKISASLSSDKLCRYYEIFLNSMSKIIGMFGGKVIKNVGDCLLYYFPESPTCKEVLRHYIDCGLAMIEAQPVLCQQLVTNKLPCVNYRISADFGQVLLMNTTDSTSIDLIGPPVNMCTKINHCAKKNEFIIGSDLYEIVKKTTEYRFQLVSSYDVGFRHPYPVYTVSLPNNKPSQGSCAQFGFLK